MRPEPHHRCRPRRGGTPRARAPAGWAVLPVRRVPVASGRDGFVPALPALADRRDLEPAAAVGRHRETTRRRTASPSRRARPHPLVAPHTRQGCAGVTASQTMSSSTAAR
jgi:hypothetical protein